MKRLFALILVLVSLVSVAFANDYIYIANPNPADRLHLRQAPDENSLSLGRYYNGAPIQRLYFAHSEDWVQVRVGLGGNSLTGYMKKAFLSDDEQPDAMPQYAAVAPVKAYQQPDRLAKQLTIAGGRLVSLMGFCDEWWHLMVHTGTSEGPYSCFVPAGYPDLLSLADGLPVNAYISNPDSNDRLHLRTAPSKNAKSLGKYYNGTVGTLKGFTADGEWLKVELYGRTGYMMTDFITIEGKTNRTYYGIPTCLTTRRTDLYHDAGLTDQARTLEQGKDFEVLGLVNENTLHVRLNEPLGEVIGFVRLQHTSFQD